MYFVFVILLLLVLPVAFITGETVLSHHAASLTSLVGKWFVFWAVGIRLFVAGVRQVGQPEFTAEKIFGLRETGAFAIVREVGFANLSMGLLGICSLFHPGWVVPAAIVGGLYYGLAGVGHLLHPDRNAKANVALVSDIFIFAVLLAFVIRSLR